MHNPHLYPPHPAYLTSYLSDPHLVLRKRDLQKIDPSEGAGDCENGLGSRDVVRRVGCHFGEDLERRCREQMMGTEKGGDRQWKEG